MFPRDVEEPLDPLVVGDDRPQQNDVVAVVSNVVLDKIVFVVVDIDVEQIEIRVALLVRVGHDVAEAYGKDFGRSMPPEAAVHEEQLYFVFVRRIQNGIH